MISSDEIRQRHVIDAGGLAIGEVEAILIDPVSWRVVALRVRLRRDMTEQVGAAKSFLRKAMLDLPTTAVQSIGDAVLLRVRAEELREWSLEEKGSLAAD